MFAYVPVAFVVITVTVLLACVSFHFTRDTVATCKAAIDEATRLYACLTLIYSVHTCVMNYVAHTPFVYSYLYFYVVTR